MKRRTLVLGAAGVAAVGAGVATALWRRASVPPVAPVAPEASRTWSQTRFDKPDGQKLALADFVGRPLLVNFWATWCPPCVKEMPLLDRFSLEQRGAGWQVVGLAIDKMELVREFLVKHPVHYPIAVAGLEALEWLRSLGNPGGGLPFSIGFDSSGTPVRRKLGEISPPELAGWVADVR